MRRERLQFGCEDEIAAGPAIEQRLLAEPVASQRQRSIALVPQREREHAGKALQGRRHAPLPDGIEQRFRVRMSPPVRRRIRRFELGTNVEMIVDLTIEGDRKPPALAAHRLRASLRQIENGQPAMPERDARGWIGPDPARIRPAMRKRLGHARQSYRRAARHRRRRAGTGLLCRTWLCTDERGCSEAHGLVSSRPADFARNSF